MKKLGWVKERCYTSCLGVGHRRKKQRKKKRKKNLSTHEGSNPRFADFSTRMLYYGAAESLKVSHTINQEYNQFSRSAIPPQAPRSPTYFAKFSWYSLILILACPRTLHNNPWLSLIFETFVQKSSMLHTCISHQKKIWTVYFLSRIDLLEIINWNRCNNNRNNLSYVSVKHVCDLV